MNIFHVGDILTGKYNNPYFITDEKMTKGEIIGIDKNGNLKIKVLEHLYSKEVGEIYEDLEPKWFSLVQKSNRISLASFAQTLMDIAQEIDFRRVIRVGNSVNNGRNYHTIWVESGNGTETPIRIPYYESEEN